MTHPTVDVLANFRAQATPRAGQCRSVWKRERILQDRSYWSLTGTVSTMDRIYLDNDTIQTAQPLPRVAVLPISLPLRRCRSAKHPQWYPATRYTILRGVLSHRPRGGLVAIPNPRHYPPDSTNLAISTNPGLPGRGRISVRLWKLLHLRMGTLVLKNSELLGRLQHHQRNHSPTVNYGTSLRPFRKQNRQATPHPPLLTLQYLLL